MLLFVLGIMLNVLVGSLNEGLGEDPKVLDPIDCKLVWSTLIRLFSVVTNGLVGFEIQAFEVRDVKKSTHRFRGICKLYLKLAKKNRKITTYSTTLG